jgi:hypothetical protein
MKIAVRKSAEDARRYWLDSNVFHDARSCSDRGDFGDTDTVGLSLRRLGVNFASLDGYDHDDAFGTFLGQHEDGWVVAIKKFDYSGYAGCEVFETLEDLKRKWELD